VPGKVDKRGSTIARHLEKILNRGVEGEKLNKITDLSEREGRGRLDTIPAITDHM